MDNELKDIELTCIQCQNKFQHTVRDQEFFARMGFTQPKRCPKCRKLNKENKGKMSWTK